MAYTNQHSFGFINGKFDENIGTIVEMCHEL